MDGDGTFCGFCDPMSSACCMVGPQRPEYKHLCSIPGPQPSAFSRTAHGRGEEGVLGEVLPSASVHSSRLWVLPGWLCGSLGRPLC